ncbi:hypothetical protein [Myxosarcina sp. GI1(2024)]
MTKPQRAIAIFQTSSDTEAALKKLDNSQFALERVFVIARNTDREKKIVDTQLCESLRERFDARIGNPPRQPSEKAIDLSQALIHLDIPIDAARFYNDLVAKDRYLVMIEGNQVDILGAEKILQECNVLEWTIYEVVREHPEVIIVDRRHHL